MRTISDFIKLDEERSGKKGPIIVGTTRGLLQDGTDGTNEGRAGDALTRWNEVEGRKGLRPGMANEVIGAITTEEASRDGLFERDTNNCFLAR